jgi:hypothetical protein
MKASVAEHYLGQCAMCGGEGYESEPIWCKRCFGTGIGPGMQEPVCRECKGKCTVGHKRVVCSRCSGSGYLRGRGGKRRHARPQANIGKQVAALNALLRK